MLKGGIFEPGNRNMFRMFSLMGKHAGSGIPDMLDVRDSEGNETP